MVSKGKVILIGDFILNQFYHGSTTAIAKDAPVPILNVKRIESILGATGLVAEIISRLGLNVIPVGIVGKDLAGNWLKKRLAELEINSNDIVMDVKRKTPVTSRIMADGVQIGRFDQITEDEPEKNMTKKFLSNIERRLEGAGMTVIADYGYGTVSSTIAEQIVRKSKGKGIDVLVSSTGENYLNYKGSNAIIKINMENALHIIKEPSRYKLDPHVILEKLSDILDIPRILLTRSSDGIAVYDNGTITEMPATRNERVDIKGIGEVMVAAMTMSLISGREFLKACEFGNVAAGLAVSKKNIESITKKEIMNAKKEYEDWFEQK